MRRVVIVQEYVPQYRVTFFEQLRKRGLDHGIDIRVVSGDPGPSLRARNDAASLKYGKAVRQREVRIGGRRLVVRRLGAAIKGADLVILEQARRNIDAYRLLGPGRSRSKMVALWGHGRDYTGPTKALDRSVQRWLTLRADWFFAYTSGGVEAVVAEGYARERTTLVQNSIDTTSLRKSVAGVANEAVDSFGLAQDLRGKSALFIGALDDSKRLPFLREAAENAFALDSDFRLLIAGDGAWRDRIERWATRHSWLTYLGPVMGAEKSIALASVQVLAMPGRVGLVAVDSFAAGTPIVTTDWKWHAPEFEYLVRNRNAVVTEDSPVQYAEGLVSILSDPAQLRALRRECLESSEIHTVSVMTDNFLGGIIIALAKS